VPRSADYTATFWNPHYDDTNLGMGVSLYNKINEYSDYDKQSMGGRLLFGYPLGEYTNLSWNYRLEQYTIEDVDDDADKVIKDIEGITGPAVYASIKRDTTDRRINPSKGRPTSFPWNTPAACSAAMTISSSISPTPTITTRYSWTPSSTCTPRPATSWKTAATAFPPFERFYLGGMNSVRGYKERTISPVYDDKEASEGYDEGDEKGGNKSFFFNAEYLVPCTRRWASWAWSFSMPETPGTTTNPLISTCTKASAPAVRWYSPLGPLRLEYGYPLDKSTG
jgi:outer membrane protein insertion porin family